MAPPLQIFICHAREDRAAAHEFGAELEAAGLSCWMASRDIAPGASRSRAITAALGASQAMLVVLSSNTGRTKKVVQEIERAAKRGMTLVAVRIEQVAPSGDLERLLSAAEWIDAPAGPTPAIIKRIAAAVSSAPGAELEVEAQPEEEEDSLPEPQVEPEPAREPEPSPEPEPIVEARTPRARPRPPRLPPHPPERAAVRPKTPAWKIAVSAAAIALVAVTCNLYVGRDDKTVTATPVTSRFDTSAYQADADTVAAALSALEGRAVPGQPTRAVRAAYAAFAPNRAIDSVSSAGFVESGVEWTAHFVPGTRCVIFTAVSSNTMAFVTENGYPAGRLVLRTALAGTPPAVPMRPVDDATAATAYGQMLARWAAHVRTLDGR